MCCEFVKIFVDVYVSDVVYVVVLNRLFKLKFVFCCIFIFKVFNLVFGIGCVCWYLVIFVMIVFVKVVIVFLFDWLLMFI